MTFRLWYILALTVAAAGVIVAAISSQTATLHAKELSATER